MVWRRLAGASFLALLVGTFWSYRGSLAVARAQMQALDADPFQTAQLFRGEDGLSILTMEAVEKIGGRRVRWAGLAQLRGGRLTDRSLQLLASQLDRVGPAVETGDPGQAAARRRLKVKYSWWDALRGQYRLLPGYGPDVNPFAARFAYVGRLEWEEPLRLYRARIRARPGVSLSYWFPEAEVTIGIGEVTGLPRVEWVQALRSRQGRSNGWVRVIGAPDPAGPAALSQNAAADRAAFYAQWAADLARLDGRLTAARPTCARRQRWCTGGSGRQPASRGLRRPSTPAGA